MADLSDEEKAKAILGEEVEPTGDETPTEPADQDPEEPDEPDAGEAADEPTEPEKPEDEGEEAEQPDESSFTKLFPNLKGESLAEYKENLETAYDNSFKEALRLNDVIKEKDKVIEENASIVARANQIIAQAGQAPVDPANPPAPTAPVAPVAEIPPEIQWIREERRRTMMTAFDKFKVDYPEVLDSENFERFRKATDGVKVALQASLGKEPTDLEIFTATAGSFGWQPTTKQARKDAAIKENASSSRTPGSGTQTARPPRKPSVSDAQIDAYQKMFTSKTREEAIKELSEVV